MPMHSIHLKIENIRIVFSVHVHKVTIGILPQFIDALTKDDAKALNLGRDRRSDCFSLPPPMVGFLPIKAPSGRHKGVEAS
jgi:hypothetical protein